MVEATKRKRIPKVEIRKGIEVEKVHRRIEETSLRCFGHKMRMSEEAVYNKRTTGRRPRGRPRRTS